MRTPGCCARAKRHAAGRYSTGAADVAAADGYQIQTTASRFAPEEGANSSVWVLLTHAYVVRPTVKWPVGAGNVISVLCSRQSKASSIVSPTTPNMASAARLLMRRLAKAGNFRPGFGKPERVGGWDMGAIL